jgi:hypothetical protein
MDDFDDGEVGLPDEMSTELPDLDTAVESEVEIELEGVAVEPAGRSSGGARAQGASTPRKSSGGASARKSAKPAKKAAKAAKAAKATKKAKPAKKAAKRKAKPAKKAAKKRKAGRKK